MFGFNRFIILFLVYAIGFLSANEGRILFLSHPKSGTRWGLYCICTMTERNPNFRLGDRKYNLIKGAVPDNQPNGFVFAGHTPMTFKPIDDSSDKLILILRNYRESMLSWGHRLNRVLQNIEQEIRQGAMAESLEDISGSRRWGYFNNLRCYDLWNPDKRFLLHYEELVQNPDMVLAQLAEFLEIENANQVVADFLENFEDHQDHLLKHAFRGKKQDESKKKDLLQHSKAIGMERCKEIDAKVKSSFPYLFDIYLSQFEIQEEAF